MRTDSKETARSTASLPVTDESFSAHLGPPVSPTNIQHPMPDLNTIEISFLGGASSIGASCILVRVAGSAFVVDCGVRYSGASPLPDLSMLTDTRVDAVLLTHAHMDHSGGLPVLAEACPAAPVFATPPTIDLVGILLRDTLRLMSGPDRESEVPLYTAYQVDALLRSLAPVKYHQPLQVGEIEIRWLPASHILGAAMILMRTPAGTILFTGDYSVTAQQTVPALGRPDFQADLVISESTYGERLHEDRNAAEERLLGQIRDVIGRGGRVLIPAFAVGRAQEVLLILKRALRNGTLADVPVFVDGMVRAVCDVYRNHEPYVSRTLSHEIRRAPHAFYTDSIRPVLRPEDRARVLDTSPCIIVASSGMLSRGAVRWLLPGTGPKRQRCHPADRLSGRGIAGPGAVGPRPLRRPQAVAIGPGDRAGGLPVRDLRLVRPCRPVAGQRLRTARPTRPQPSTDVHDHRLGDPVGRPNHPQRADQRIVEEVRTTGCSWPPAGSAGPGRDHRTRMAFPGREPRDKVLPMPPRRP